MSIENMISFYFIILFEYQWNPTKTSLINSLKKYTNKCSCKEDYLNKIISIKKNSRFLNHMKELRKSGELLTLS